MRSRLLTTGRLTAVILVGCACLSVAACETPPAESAGEPSTGHVEQIAGSDVKRVTLAERAAERLGIETAQVSEVTVAGKTHKAIQYAALLYDSKGATWVYTSTEPLAFVRQPVTVDRIQGDLVILTDGPAVGTIVVTIGVAELYGVETGVGK